MIEQYIGSESSWAIWSFDSDRVLRDLSAGTFTGRLYRRGREAGGVDLAGNFAGAVGAGIEPTGTPNLTYTPSADEAFTAGPWFARVVWSVGDTVVFDGPVAVKPRVL